MTRMHPSTVRGRTLPTRCRVVEVGLRDGLQNERTMLPTTEKLACARALLAAGVRELEIGAFVRADRVPAMADTELLVRDLSAIADARCIALVPNMRGMERAVACGARTVAVFTAASETFAQRNIGMSIDDSLRGFEAVMTMAQSRNIAVRGYISTAWWCPFEGAVDVARVLSVASALHAMGCYEISIADTIGRAEPSAIAPVLDAVAAVVPRALLAVHFHDTFGHALGNVRAALDCEVTTIDASIGGLGGCPFAPGAAGNVATESVVALLQGMNIDTGLDLPALRRIGAALRARLRPIPG